MVSGLSGRGMNTVTVPVGVSIMAFKLRVNPTQSSMEELLA